MGGRFPSPWFFPSAFPIRTGSDRKRHVRGRECARHCAGRPPGLGENCPRSEAKRAMASDEARDGWWRVTPVTDVLVLTAMAPPDDSDDIYPNYVMCGLSELAMVRPDLRGM